MKRRMKKEVELINKKMINEEMKNPNDKKYKKFIKFLKKDLAKGFGIPKKVLFGKEKNVRKYDKKLIKKRKNYE